MVAVLPQASVAVNVLMTVYSLAQAPGVEASVNVTVAAPQASDAVGKAKEGVSGHSIVVGARHGREYWWSIILNSDCLRIGCGVTASIGCSKCSYDSILISTSTRSGGISKCY